MGLKQLHIIIKIMGYTARLLIDGNFKNSENFHKTLNNLMSKVYRDGFFRVQSGSGDTVEVIVIADVRVCSTTYESSKSGDSNLHDLIKALEPFNDTSNTGLNTYALLFYDEDERPIFFDVLDENK
jgi:hypothetical protein